MRGQRKQEKENRKERKIYSQTSRQQLLQKEKLRIQILDMLKHKLHTFCLIK